MRAPLLRRGCLVVYWTAMFVMTHWPDIDRLAPSPRWLPEGSDRLAHFGFYAGWMILWWWALTAQRRSLPGRHFRWLIVGGAAYGIFDELTQGLTRRTPDIFDWLCDVAGLCAAALLLRAWQTRRPSRPAAPRRRAGV